jgi:tricorn protease
VDRAKAAGIARRLSSPEGQELLPKFSPDGQTIAFSGNYDGNTDVYAMPAQGGTPTRLTHHPDGDLVVEWYPDGKRMAFQVISSEFRTWKRYRGGMASDLWFYDFANNTSEKFADCEGTDALPMWHQNKIYFLSGRDERKKLNIWAYDLTTKQAKQVTKFTDYDVKWPSIGPDAIVFENGGKLHLLDLAGETSKPISIQVPADLPEARAQLKDASKNLQSFSLSPSGKRALFEARGEIFTVPEKLGSVRNLTNTSGIAERFPAWSPDGKYVAYFSDRNGEYELYVRAGEGSGKERLITTNSAVNWRRDFDIHVLL